MEIFGKYKETIFRNEADGFTIFKFELTDFVPEFDDKTIVCKGVISGTFMCLPLKITGEKMGENKRAYCAVTSVEPCVKNDDEAIKFLSSACCKGISERLAKSIIDAVGKNIFSLADNPNAFSILTNIEDIGPGRAKTILDAINQAKQQEKLLECLKEFGGSYLTAEKILIQYGANALNALKRNPYEVGSIGELSFIVCDTMARQWGFSAKSEERIEALVLNVITRDYQSGNAYITFNKLCRKVNYMAKHQSAFPNVRISKYQMLCVCDNMQNIKTEILDDEIRYYFRKSYEDEIKTAKNIHRFQKFKKKSNVDIKKLIAQCERELHITYSEKQKDCFNFLSTNGIKVITGGPGTGKSTVINGLTYAFAKLYPEKKIVMMAPTGRAAQRISEITGKEAGTIHRILGLCPFEDNRIFSNYYADYPADMIIVDESSMIDNELMAILTDCLKSNCLLIVVGDIDQLPSIGTGSVLRDMIKAGIETVKLDVNYRQKGKSIIIDNAIAVNTGNSNLITSDNFIIKEFSNPETLKLESLTLFTSLYDLKNPYSVQILCPQNKGKAGTITINQAIQKSLKTGKKFSANAFYAFNIGDKVMATVNNYDYDYFNGDVGIITDANEVTFTVKFSTKSVRIPRENIRDFQLAYACTIHKSQGSEYDTIIICMPEEAKSMIKRNLLYTAITRAKKQVYIYTQKGCIQMAVNKTSTESRTSALAERIKSLT